MTQSTTETNNGYFSLDHPVIKPSHNNKVAKSGLLNRRQQHSAYLQQLELPSLPPLSQLIPVSKIKKEQPETNLEVTATTADVAAAVAAATNIYHPLQSQQPPMYFNSNEFNQSQQAFPASNMLMDPVAFSSNNNMMPLDPMYSNGIDPSNDPTAAAAAAAAMMATTASTNTLASNAPNGYLYNQPPIMPAQEPMQQQQQQQQQQQRSRQMSNSSASSAEKIYSFVAIPGTNQKKRPRRRYDEIERLYHCNWPGCTKAYGTLNHLNAHVSMQKHGPKRHPAEFKEMRKEWRRQKKEKEAHKKRSEELLKQQQQPILNNASFSNMPYAPLPTNGSMPMNSFY